MGSGSHSKRKKKRSQKHSKKSIRSTKDKSKKRKPRHDSVSCSDDDSMSSSSVSYFSSEDDHRSRKRARFPDRKDRKKRAKRSSLVSESSGDDTPHSKKRKRSKRSKDSKSKKKRHGKKRRRDPSVSVSSGRSRSCSLSEHSDGDEREFEKSGAKERKGRNKDKKGNGRKKSRHRSRSCSPCSLRSLSPSYNSEDPVIEENNPKRLKSVIVAARDVEEIEVKESNWEGNKDEIVFEHDDYPSRSNDSNEGVSKREALTYLHDVSSQKSRSIDDSNRLASPTDVQASKFPESQRVDVEEIKGIGTSNSGADQLKGSRSEVSPANTGSNCDDLEVVLRQKALENLLKRQGKLPIKNTADKKGSLDNEVKISSSLKTDQVQHVSGEQRGVKYVQIVGGMSDATNTNAPSSPKVNDVHLPNRDLGNVILTVNKAPGVFVDSGSKLGLGSPRQIYIGGRNTWRRQLVSQESSQPNLSTLKETTDNDYKQKMVLQESSSPLKETVGDYYKQKMVLHKSSQPNLSALEQTADDNYKRKLALQELSQANLSATGEPKDEDSKPRLTLRESCQQNVSVPTAAAGIDSRKGSGSACVESKVSEKLENATTSEPSATEGQSSNEKTNKPEEGSQFEKKTMSVMRGGEMVEVNYKVYIPKKAPALARRQLKR